MKTNELSGPALDWAVAKCEGASDFWFDTVATHWVKLNGEDRALRYGWGKMSYLPSTDWAQGGPIIEREGVFCKPTINKGWRSYQRDPFSNGICNSQYGPTPLIAAMRCYVASKLGDTVNIPEELA
jgi:hypothetical protein